MQPSAFLHLSAPLQQQSGAPAENGDAGPGVVLMMRQHLPFLGQGRVLGFPQLHCPSWFCIPVNAPCCFAILEGLRRITPTS